VIRCQRLADFTEVAAAKDGREQEQIESLQARSPLPQILRLMSDESTLRYTDLAALIQMARARGWPTIRIVRSMSSGLTYADALRLARKAAPLLDISVSEFMRLRKNE
jgi:hypothetical protein